jgi:hypothetical protein
VFTLAVKLQREFCSVPRDVSLVDRSDEVLGAGL